MTSTDTTLLEPGLRMVAKGPSQQVVALLGAQVVALLGAHVFKAKHSFTERSPQPLTVQIHSQIMSSKRSTPSPNAPLSR